MVTEADFWERRRFDPVANVDCAFQIWERDNQSLGGSGLFIMRRWNLAGR